MRNLKKVLSLVLCMAVMLSVMVVGAGAAFTDQSKIENTEAVDACVALNIINGYKDGSYKPEGNITRAEACKMICIALNGGEEPTLGTSAKASFTDTKGHWAEKYIESCVAQGIVAGIGGGKFNPAGNITGTQFAKMLLTALGFNADTEGYVGAPWEVKVNVDASAKGLYVDLAGMDPAKALIRDNAAQMVWNALNAYEVEYKYNLVTENGQLVSKLVLQDKVVGSNNDKITLLEDKYEAETEKGILTSVNYDEDDQTYTTVVSGVDSFDASADYSNLIGQQVKVMYTEDNKTNDVTLLGIYATEKNKTVTALYGDADIDGNTATIDGKDYDITGITTIATNGTVIKSADYNDWDNYPYAEVTLVDNDNDKVYEYAVVNPFKVAQLTSLTAKKAYFENAVDDTDTYNMDLDDLASYKGMAEDDYVYLTENTYTVSGDWEVTKADTVSGKVAGIKGTTNEKSIKVDGAWYEQAAASVDVPSNGDDLDYVVVANGYFFATEGATGSADKLALVLKVGSQDFDGDYRDVKLLLSDGSTKTTKAYVKDGSEKEAPVVATLYTYTENSDGYVLKVISDGDDIGMDTTVLSNKYYNSKTNKVQNDENDNTTTGTRLAADAKVFVLYEKTTSNGSDSYKGKIVTGATADKWDDDCYTVTVAYTDNNVKIAVVNLATAEEPNATDDAMYGVIVSEPYTDVDADDNDVYVIDLLTESGVVKDIVVDADEFDEGFVKNQLVSYKMDGSDYVEFLAEPTGATAVVGAVTDVSGKYVTILTADGNTIELKVDEDDSTVLYFDSDAAAEASGSIKKATKKDANNYYANIMVVYKDSAESDASNIIWGAAVDVNNQLQNASDKDVLIAIPVNP